MPVQTGWDGDNRDIIWVTVTGRWVWDDLESGLTDAIALMDSVDHPVHFIIDIRGSSLDFGSALGQIQKAATPETHRNEGVKVVIGASRMVRMVYSAYRKVIQAMGKDQVFHFVDTLDEAYRIIQQ